MPLSTSDPTIIEILPLPSIDHMIADAPCGVIPMGGET
jgi:hypothetical protein